jgi:hypothetical protein
MDRLKYRRIENGWDAGLIVTGYEVQLPCGFRGVGETLDEALRAATLARTTHEARVERLEREAAQRAQEWRAAHKTDETEIPF